VPGNEPPPGANGGPEQWLAQGAAVASGRLAALVAAEPDLQELRRLGPDLVVLRATAAQVARLQAACPGELMVEKDEPLAPPSP
jgi:hypothetical protein